jgi:hypothetical protein
MKLADLEDGAQIVTKEYLDTKLERLQISIDRLENKLDSRINRVERTVWFAIAASIAQIVTVILKAQ